MISIAKESDCEALTSLTFSSKAYWGFTAEQIKAWKQDLTITSNYLTTHTTYKLESRANVIEGYYSYIKQEDFLLVDNLFIAPESIGKGLGRILMNHFFEQMTAEKIDKTKLYSEIKAEEFYLKIGFETHGYFWSSLSDRKLPLMVKELSNYN